MKYLIGYTGFIGSYLARRPFDGLFNSKNIHTLKSDNADLYLSCLPATKWLINKNLTADLANIYKIIDILRKSKFRTIYLISTIDVYSVPGSNEDTVPSFDSPCYGENRFFFEGLVSQLDFRELRIFRLPALFGQGLKKNVLFDLINDHELHKINLNSTYQWYCLENLNNDIESHGCNLFSEPIKVSEIVERFFPEKVHLLCGQTEVHYDFRTKFRESGYFYTKSQIMEELNAYINCENRNNRVGMGRLPSCITPKS